MKMNTTQIFLGYSMLAVAAVLLPLGARASEVIDLDTPGDGPVTSSDSVVWSQTAIQPTGTGVIDPFLRVQDSNDTGGSEQGYNLDITTTAPMDDLSTSGSGGNYVHSVLFSDMDASGGYVKLLLDANQTGSNPQLSLTDLAIWVGDSQAPQNSGSLSALVSALGTADYELDAGTDKQVNLAVQTSNGFDANNGSGSGDLYVYIPVSYFAGGGTYFTLYCEFAKNPSLDPAYPNDDGFEEWAYVSGPNSVPDSGGTLALLGSAIAGLGFLVRRLKACR